VPLLRQNIKVSNKERPDVKHPEANAIAIEGENEG
jgi:hypothetical protein